MVLEFVQDMLGHPLLDHSGHALCLVLNVREDVEDSYLYKSVLEAKVPNFAK
jgi:hypothetical protein